MYIHVWCNETNTWFSSCTFFICQQKQRALEPKQKSRAALPVVVVVVVEVEVVEVVEPPKYRNVRQNGKKNYIMSKEGVGKITSTSEQINIIPKP